MERIYCYQFKSNNLKKYKFFAAFFFFAFLESALNFQLSEKSEADRSSISKAIDSERCAYLNA